MVYDNYTTHSLVGLGNSYEDEWHAEVVIPRDSVLSNEYNDVRFTDSQGVDLPHHRKYNDPDKAVFVVRIPADISYIHLYRGDLFAKSQSNPHTTYFVYEDFKNGGVGWIGTGWNLVENSLTATTRFGSIFRYLSALDNVKVTALIQSTTPETLTEDISIGMMVATKTVTVHIEMVDSNCKRRSFLTINSDTASTAYEGSWVNSQQTYLQVAVGGTGQSAAVYYGPDPSRLIRYPEYSINGYETEGGTVIGFTSQNATEDQIVRALYVQSLHSEIAEISAPIPKNYKVPYFNYELIFDNIYIPASRKSDTVESIDMKKEFTYTGKQYIYTNTVPRMPKIIWYCEGTVADYNNLVKKIGQRRPLFAEGRHYKGAVITGLKRLKKSSYDDNVCKFEVEFDQHTVDVW